MKPVLVDTEAEIELVNSVGFYEARQSGLGLEFEFAARQAVQTIQSDPERFPVHRGGVRRHVMDRFPFVVYFAELPDVIWILAFAHASRRPGYWQKRL